MKQTLRIATLILVTGLIALSLFSPAKSQVPLPPLTIDGYVTIQTVSGTNITAPAGLNVYTKQQNTTIPNNAGSTTTNAAGYYVISVGNANNTVPAEGSQIDMWVQNINVTRITFSYHTGELKLNLTVVETTAPTIQVISPLPGAYVSSTVPVWVNATLTDNLAINATSISMTLNQTQVTWAFNRTTGLLSSENTLTPGLYVANVTVSNIAGYTAVQTWDFIASPGVPPTVSITSPTTANPAYVRSGNSVSVTFLYTEPNPLNWTVTISNAVHTVPSVSNVTAITPGTSTATVSVPIDATAPEGTYNVNVTMYNIYYLSTMATQTSAVVVVNTAPTVTITSPVNGAYVTTSPVWINGTVTSTDMGSLQPTINDSRFTLSVWVSATGAFSFSNGSAIANGPLSANVSFTDLAGNIGSQTVTFTVDTAPPVIATPTQVPAATSVPAGQAVTVSANITDTISGVTSATLYYSNGTATWNNVAMTKNATTGLWQATIPGYPAGTTVSYYVSAIDGAGNSGVNNNAGTYYVYTVLPEFPTITMLLILMVFAAAVIVLTKRRKTTKT
jgi:hypothetical protein